MGSDGGSGFVLETAAASGGRMRKAGSAATTIVSSTGMSKNDGFLLPAPSSTSKPSHLDPRAQEFRPKIIAAPPLPPFVYPYTYPCEFSPCPLPPAPPPPCAPLRPAARPSDLAPSGRENASRSLLLSSVPPGVSEGCLLRELELFGPVRGLEMENIEQGLVVVHFYDVRHSQRALAEIQEQHMMQQSRLAQHYTALMRAGEVVLPPPPPPPLPPPLHSRGLIGGCAVWAQYSSAPMRVSKYAGGGLLDAHNQGTLVVFNLDSEVSSGLLKNVFEAFGAVKELRETPSKRQHRFVEFYDVRDAARALAEMNGREICGKRVKIEFSRPGGQARRLRNSVAGAGAIAVHVAADNLNLFDARPHALAPDPSTRSFPTQPRLLDRDRSPCLPSSHSSNSNIRGEVVAGGRTSMAGGALSNANVCLSSLAPPARPSPVAVDGDDLNRRKSKSSIDSKHQSGHSPRGGGGAAAIAGLRTGGCGTKNWNVRMNEETQFAFDEAKATSNWIDPRTTVMIKNIPNKYSQKLLLNMLDQHCISCNEQIVDDGQDDDSEPPSSYDFVYLPIDFKNKCNVGYGFVNMTSPKATLRLHKAFHKQPWEAFNSRKICEVTYARLQGLDALKEHFKNSKFACDTDEYLPVIFSPPRDGMELSEPMAIGGHTSKGRQRVPQSPLATTSLPTNGKRPPAAAATTQQIGGVGSGFGSAAAAAADDGDVDVVTLEAQSHHPRHRHHHRDSALDDDVCHYDHRDDSSSTPSPPPYASTATTSGCSLRPRECQQQPKPISCPEVS
ncbi:protein terminal ear1 [Nymphaea colorata]|nr:protein terminal ear1 [Nymphaea colorata]